MTYLLFDCLILRYSEIGLKGKNRHVFEQKLKNSILRHLKDIDSFKFLNENGRLILVKASRNPFSKEQIQQIQQKLQFCFGLESYSFGFIVPSEWQDIKQCVLNNITPIYKDKLQDKEFVTFRVRCRRSYKKFILATRDVEINLTTLIFEDHPKIKIDLNSAELSLGVEIRHESSFIYFDIIKGPGGLAVGSSSPVLALLSGGIDSPVACLQAMKRGCRVHFLTFHSYPYTNLELLDKIASLVSLLNEHQIPGKFFACNMSEAQKEIRDKCNSRFRTILYRRIMMKVSTITAQWMKISALLTGESVGQVASQTIANMSCIDHASELLILRPLVCHDKNEIMKIARDLGSFEISNIQAQDSCTVFAPSSPATKANLSLILKEEAKLDLENLILNCLENTILIDNKSMKESNNPDLIKFFHEVKDNMIF